MPEKRQIYDQFGGVVSTLHFFGASEPWHTRKVQDVEPILDANKAEITAGHNGYTPSRDMRRVASIPVVIYENWAQEFCRIEGLQHFGNRDRDRWRKFVRKKINDRDNKFVRTVEGQI